VLAAAPRVSYKLRKFIRRNRTPVSVAATMVLLLVVGAVVSFWQAVEVLRLPLKVG